MQEEGAGSPILTRFIWKKKVVCPIGPIPTLTMFSLLC